MSEAAAPFSLSPPAHVGIRLIVQAYLELLSESAKLAGEATLLAVYRCYTVGIDRLLHAAQYVDVPAWSQEAFMHRFKPNLGTRTDDQELSPQGCEEVL
jgi:hypothetical protein